MKIIVEEFLQEEKITQKGSKKEIQIPKKIELGLSKVFAKFYGKAIKEQIVQHPYKLSIKRPEAFEKLSFRATLENIMKHGFELGKYRGHIKNPERIERKKPKNFLGRRNTDRDNSRLKYIFLEAGINRPYSGAIGKILSKAAQKSLPNEEIIPPVKEILRRAFIRGFKHGIREGK